MADIAQQVIGGKWGKCFTVINGVREELITLKDVEITYDKAKTEVNQLNQTVTQHKSNGITITGSATIYYNTARFRKMVMDYISTGIDTYFDMEITNDDGSSTSGQQVAIATGCNIDSGTLATLDIESEMLEDSLDFTVNGIKIIQHFTTN